MEERLLTLESELSEMEERVRKLVECPICYEIRADQKIYVCINGHHICSVCKEKVVRRVLNKTLASHS
jgi:ribosomal protein L37AE/L43A